MGVFQEIWIDIKELGDKTLIDLPSFESIGYTKIEIANCKGYVVVNKDDLETLRHVYSIYAQMNKSLYHKLQSYSSNIPVSESTFEDSALARAYYNGFTAGYRHVENIISKAFLRSGNQLNLKGCVIQTHKYIKHRVMRYKLRKDGITISPAHLIDLFRWFGKSQGSQIKCIEHGIELGEIRYGKGSTVNSKLQEVQIKCIESDIELVEIRNEKDSTVNSKSQESQIKCTESDIELVEIRNEKDSTVNSKSQESQIKCTESDIELVEIKNEKDSTVNMKIGTEKECAHLILTEDNPTLSIALLQELGNTENDSLGTFEKMLYIKDEKLKKIIFNRIKTITKDGIGGMDICSLMSALHKKEYVSLSNKAATLRSFKSSFPKAMCSSSYFSRMLLEEIKGVQLKNTQFYLKFLSLEL